MRRLVSILAVVVLALSGVASTESGSIRYYVQLVRGTDSDQPPQAGCRPIGIRLAGTLHGVLKWKHYWEISRQQAEVLPGQTARIALSNAREVAIDLTLPGKRTVAAFQSGQLVDRTVAPVSEALTLIGGDRDQRSAWFIVVRSDKPGE